MKAGIKSRTIMTKEAFENAITVMMALGGSTNGVSFLFAPLIPLYLSLTREGIAFTRVSARGGS